MFSAKRKRTARAVSRKKNSFLYYLTDDGQNIRVCKTFYLSTLDISQKRINNYHATKSEAAATPTHHLWGKKGNNTVPEEVKNGIRRHIKSIPRVEAHYVRADTNKEYISQWGLSVTALYRKYIEQCEADETTPAKLHLYRHIFNTEFNIAFHFPKKDRCDKCEEIKANQRPTNEEKAGYDAHIRGKLETKEERDRDRASIDTFAVCFDLENVFALPRANVSNFFYRRKLNVFNMTAHCSVDKQGYGAIWNEAQSGRSGNDIASSVMKLLHVIVEDHTDDPRIRKITLWSDSCVPQNRNSVFSTAIRHFMLQHPMVKEIEHKYCQPGHSSIQEVDNFHSQIETACGPAEIYSPVGLMRILKVVNKFRVVQMKPEDFKEYQEIAVRCKKYSEIPYTKVKSLLYTKDEPKVVRFKTTFQEDFKAVTVIRRIGTRTNNGSAAQATTDYVADVFRGLKTAKHTNGLQDAKKKDIKAMLKYMPAADKVYMSLISQ